LEDGSIQKLALAKLFDDGRILGKFTPVTLAVHRANMAVRQENVDRGQ
jgi:hypothetical protein